MIEDPAHRLIRPLFIRPFVRLNSGINRTNVLCEIGTFILLIHGSVEMRNEEISNEDFVKNVCFQQFSSQLRVYL